MLSLTQNSTFSSDGFPLVSVQRAHALEARSGSEAAATCPESLVSVGWELHAACAGSDRIPPSAGGTGLLVLSSSESPQRTHAGTSPAQAKSTANLRPPPGAAHFFQQSSYKPCSKAPVSLTVAVSLLILWAHRGFHSSL